MSYGPLLPPWIAVTLATNPPNFTIGAPVELAITAVSHAPYPITISTWSGPLNLDLAQLRGNFDGADRDTGMKLPLPDIQFNRMKEESYTLGGPDDADFVTLEPGQPMKFTDSFGLAHGLFDPSSTLPKDQAELLPGHRYFLNFTDQYNTLYWWKKGRKEDVLNVPGEPSRNAIDSDGKPIVLSLDEPAEFRILPLDN